MAEIRPFHAIRYDFERLNRDLSAVLAPPYDILDQADKDRLLAGSDRNVVKLDLPHVPPGDEGPAEAYRGSADDLQAWIADGTLVREAEPVLFAYHQAFDYAGQEFVRRSLIAAVELHPFEDGVVLPHEHVFSGPKADRLALMKATRCALSPILGLIDDPEDRIGGALADVVSAKPDATGTLDGVENRVWRIADPSVIGAVQEAMAGKLIYIADGHHRYGTALNYRDELTTELGHDLAPDHPARFCLFVLASMDDPGCLVLPTHRVFTDSAITARGLVDAWSAGCNSCAPAEADIGVYDGQTGETLSLAFSNRSRLAELEPERSEAWCGLDLAYLHRYLIDELLTVNVLNGKPPAITYPKSDEQARKLADSVGAVAVFVKATPMEHLRAVCEAGDLMPHKSTYFYPKVATGLVIQPLE
ncbi:MAG: DUF1015 domain-containing protein [Planctomycetes bacterium]|nr:DUF1015 domain-containing protein [Planctomycetota bacterium]